MGLKGGYFHRNRQKNYCPPCLLDVLARDGEDVGTEGDVDDVLERLTRTRLVGGRTTVVAECAPAFRSILSMSCDRCGDDLT